MSSPTPLDPTDVVVLTGAGISADAGVPVAFTLYDYITDCIVHQHWAAAELKRLARPPRSKSGGPFIRFETFLMWLRELFDPELTFFDFLDAYTVPGELQRRLALSSQRGATVVTVNFDDLLERAVSDAGGTPRSVVLADTRVPGQQAIVKLHGARRWHQDGKTISSPHPISSTIDRIAALNRGLGVDGAHMAELADLVHDKTLVVFGYSASDDIDVVPVLRQSRPRKVVWVDHSIGRIRPIAITSSGLRQHPWMRLLDHWAGAGASVDIHRGPSAAIAEKLGFADPGPRSIASPPVDWRDRVRTWAAAVQHQDPTGLGLAALMFTRMQQDELGDRALRESTPSPDADGSWTEARRTYEQAQSALLARTSDLPTALRLGKRAAREAAVSGNTYVAILADLVQGRALFLRQDYVGAQAHFESALPLTTPRTRLEAQSVLWIGRALLWSSRVTDSLPHLLAAESMCRDLGDLDTLLDAVDALGIARRKLLLLDEADRSLSEGESIADALGYPDRRFTLRYARGLGRFLSGDTAEAMDLVNESLSFIDTDGDDEEADARLLLGVMLRESGDLAGSLRELGRARSRLTVLTREIESLIESEIAITQLRRSPRSTTALSLARHAATLPPIRSGLRGRIQSRILASALDRNFTTRARRSLAQCDHLPPEDVLLLEPVMREYGIHLPEHADFLARVAAARQGLRS